jgi:hypothetical protein
MKTTIIPMGYRLTITSWENDADYYQTHTIEGLFENDVKFYIAVLKLFKSGSNDTFCYGNLNSYRSNHNARVEAAQEAVNEIVEKFWGSTVPEHIEQFADVREAMPTLLGYSENFIFRVFESVKVEWIPHPIEIEDETEKFMKG